MWPQFHIDDVCPEPPSSQSTTLQLHPRKTSHRSGSTGSGRGLNFHDKRAAISALPLLGAAAAAGTAADRLLARRVTGRGCAAPP